MQNYDLINSVDRIYENNQSTKKSYNEYIYFDQIQYDLDDDKQYKKYIQDIERDVRMSFEYRYLMNYLRNECGMNTCSFLQNVFSTADNSVRIEIHHSPLTLYDYCTTVVNKRKDLGQDLSVYAVSAEVMYLHSIGAVGLIPVSQTVHEMIHNNYLFVPTDKVRGNYRAFVNAYEKYIDPVTLDLLEVAEKATITYNNRHLELLNNHKMYIDVNGSYNIPGTMQAENMIKGHINEVKGKLIDILTVVG